MAIIRISRAFFPEEKFDEVKNKLNDSEKILKPAVSQLDGCLRFYAGIDPVTHSMVNISIWNSLANAKQLDNFPPMLKLAGEFIKSGVEFDRPVINYLGSWEF
jgi:hypothetical protein